VEWRVQGVEECGEWQESWEDFWVGPKRGRDVFFLLKVRCFCRAKREI
jgi:hypothetical protein